MINRFPLQYPVKCVHVEFGVFFDRRISSDLELFEMRQISLWEVRKTRHFFDSAASLDLAVFLKIGLATAVSHFCD